MSTEMNDMVQARVEKKSNTRPKRLVTRETCTVFDVYQVAKNATPRKIVLGTERSIPRRDTV